MNHILSVNNAFKSYFAYEGLFRRSKTVVGAVNNVSLGVSQRESLGIVGESGSGKTTLARIMAGITPQDSGELLYKGIPVHPNSPVYKEYRKNVQMVFQNPDGSLNPKLTVFSALSDVLIGRVEKSALYTEALKLLELTGLTKEHLDRYPHELSGGQKQRVSIARAMALKPEVIIADEPVSSLDVSVAAQIINLFTSLKQSGDITLLFISHDLAVVSRLCERIAVIKSGAVVEMGRTMDVINSPKHEYTKELLNAVL